MDKFFKNIKKIILGTMVFSLILAPSGAALAVSSNQAGGNNQSIENPGILPTNPFYFIKNWRRNTQRVISLSALSKANLELDILNEKVAEIDRLYDVLDGNNEVIKDAAKFYLESLGRLQSYIGGIKDNSSSSQADRFLDRLLDISGENFLLFNDLESRSDIRIGEVLIQLQDELAKMDISVFNRLDKADNFRGRLDKVLDKQKNDFAQLLAIGEFLNALENAAPNYSFLKDILLQAKEDVLAETQAAAGLVRSRVNLVALVESLTGSRARQIAILDDLREVVSDLDLKSELSVIRQRILDIAKDEKSVSKPAAENMMQKAQEAIVLLEARLKDANVKSNVLNTLLARAKFNLAQAETSFKDNQYEEAFGQTTAALSAAKNALYLLISCFNQGGKSILDIELKRLKEKYDKISGKASDNGVTLEAFPDFFLLLSTAEKALVKVSDLATIKQFNFDKVSQALREAKFLVWQSDLDLKDLLEQLEARVEFKKSDQPLIQRVLPFSEEKKEDIKKEAIEELKKKSLSGQDNQDK